jgi:thiol-disulfide isomerase/thioredoxin
MKIIKIGAIWCSGCLVMKPRWKKIEQQIPNLNTKYFDYDESRSEVEKYNLDISRLPTFIFLDKEENELIRLTGEVSEKELSKVILENINK